jgi:NAD(P)H dehydrogenase (quinone)
VERRAYGDASASSKAVLDYVQRLRQAEGINFVFSSWWYGTPAILKGYFDRVWLLGVPYEFGPKLLGHCIVAFACLVCHNNRCA